MYFWSCRLQEMCSFKCITGLFLKPFRSKPVNRAQKHLRSAEKNFYQTFLSFSAKYRSGKVFPIVSEILGLLDNILTPNYKYSRINRENLPLTT